MSDPVVVNTAPIAVVFGEGKPFFVLVPAPKDLEQSKILYRVYEAYLERLIKDVKVPTKMPELDKFYENGVIVDAEGAIVYSTNDSPDGSGIYRYIGYAADPEDY